MACEFENLNRVYKVHSDLLDFFSFLKFNFFSDFILQRSFYLFSI